MRRILLASTSVAAALVMAACGGSDVVNVDTSGTKPGKDTIPASVVAAGALNQTGQVGTELPSPLTVVVRNKAGVALKGVGVVFAVTAGGGQMGSPSVATDDQGQASTKWILGLTAGTQTATATVQGLSPVSFTATATPGPVAALVKVAGDSQSAAVGTAVPIAPSVKVVDANGNAIASVVVTFSVSSGGGSLTGPLVASGSDGVARVGAWTLGTTLGANSLTATAQSVSVVFTATAIAGTAATVQFTSTNPATLIVGQTTQLTVKALDANGNQVTNATPTFSSSNSAVATVDATGLVRGVASGTATITASVGTASATRSFTVAGHSGSVLYDTTAVGLQPGPAAIAQGSAFVAQLAGTSIIQISQTGAIVAAIALGGTPADLATDQRGSILVAADSTNDRLAIVDIAGGTVGSTIALTGRPSKLVLSRDGKTAYALLKSGQMDIVNIATSSVAYVMNVGIGATSSRLSPADTILYVGGANTLRALNLNTRLTIWTQSIAGSVADFETSSDGGYLYVVNGATGKVDLFRLSNLTVLGSLDVGGQASAVTMTPDGQELYVSQQALGQATVVLVSSPTNLFPSRIAPTGGAPSRVAFDPIGTWGIITNKNGWVNLVH